MCDILVVDDIPVNCMLLSKILNKFGNSPDVAQNGLEAYEKIRKNQYDFVFMDCQMPVMDGYTAMHEIGRYENGTGRHTIIVALTADAMTKDREKCLAAGMDDYIGKPFMLEQISEMLHKWLARKGETRDR